MDIILTKINSVFLSLFIPYLLGKQKRTFTQSMHELKTRIKIIFFGRINGYIIVHIDNCLRYTFSNFHHKTFTFYASHYKQNRLIEWTN